MYVNNNDIQIEHDSIYLLEGSGAIMRARLNQFPIKKFFLLNAFGWCSALALRTRPFLSLSFVRSLALCLYLYIYRSRAYWSSRRKPINQ